MTVPVYGTVQNNDEDAIALSGTSRHELMAKLAASRTQEAPTIIRPSKCILIQNAFEASKYIIFLINSLLNVKGKLNLDGTLTFKKTSAPNVRNLEKLFTVLSIQNQK